MVCITRHSPSQPLRSHSNPRIQFPCHWKWRLFTHIMSVILPRLADILLSPATDLRAQLAAVINPPHHQNPPPPPSAHVYSDARASSSASPHEHSLDSTIGSGGPGRMMDTSGAGDSGGEDGGKGGKRGLSQSKRAAQNRAAQVCRHLFNLSPQYFLARRLLSVVAQGCVSVVWERVQLAENFWRWLLALSILMSSTSRSISLHNQFHLTESIPTTKRRLYQETWRASTRITRPRG